MPDLIKICGLTTPETLEAAIEAGADLVGFVRYEKSPRHIDLAKGTRLSAKVKGRAKRVVLTVNATDEELDEVMRAFSPDILQLHGAESPQRVRDIAKRYNLPILKAIGIENAADIEVIERYRDATDYLLLDAKPVPGAVLPGGNGLTFDWKLVSNLDPSIRFMLSGGLTPDNVAEAIAETHVKAVDVSSGVESAPGVKDVGKIKAFIAAARQAWYHGWEVSGQ